MPWWNSWTPDSLLCASVWQQHKFPSRKWHQLSWSKWLAGSEAWGTKNGQVAVTGSNLTDLIKVFLSKILGSLSPLSQDYRVVKQTLSRLLGIVWEGPLPPLPLPLNQYILTIGDIILDIGAWFKVYAASYRKLPRLSMLSATELLVPLFYTSHF